MKALVFKIPVVESCSVYVQEDRLPHFYDHLHLHPEIQLTCILKGNGTLFAGNHIGRFGPGDIYWIPSNQPHLFKCDPTGSKEANTERAHSLSVYFQPSGLLGSVFNIPELSELARFIRREKGICQVPGPDGGFMKALFVRTCQATGSGRIIAFLRLLQQFVFHTNRKIHAGAETRPLNELECIRMNDVYQFTMKYFSEKISLQTAAGIANMTPQAFCRYFKRSTRKTYMHFLNEVRVNHARKLICDKENIPLYRVAAACGFENASGFTRSFKRVAGITPAAYRKKLLEGLRDAPGPIPTG